MGKVTFFVLAACLLQTINCGKFGPFGPFGPYAAGGLGLFGAAPSPFADPLLDSQVLVNQLMASLRMTSMEFGRQIGQTNAMTGKQISSAKYSMSAILMQTKNEIKASQNAAKLQGINIDTCVAKYDSAMALVSVKDLKQCAHSQEMFEAKANMGKLKFVQTKAKNIVPTCQLKFPSPLQTEEVNSCVSDAVDALTTEYTTIRDQNTDLLNDASQSTCIQDIQTNLEEAIDDAITDFHSCVAEAPIAI